MMRALVTRALVVLFSLVPCLFAEGGVLLPMDKTEPDEKILSIAEMEIRIRIDNGHARVSTKQIFLNKTATIQEGTYLFSLPGRADISNFAVWDDVVRIPGVILERRRAEEIYNEAKRQVIDPGLLQQGERDVDEARRTSVFSARVTPIPAYGTKRLEMEFQERLAVEQFQSFLSIPLKPTAYRPVTAGRLLISVEVLSPQPLKAVELVSKSYRTNQFV